MSVSWYRVKRNARRSVAPSGVVWWIAATFTAAVLSTGGAFAADFAARVVGVHDGDTMTLRTADATYKVRLFGVDAPETGQPFGSAAKEYASRLSFGRDVSVHRRGTDVFGRMLVELTLPDGTLLNEVLVQAGYAWWFRRYSRSPRLRMLEETARAEHRGLWSQPGQMAPWEYRALRRGKH